ncbi:MAG: flagellar hook-associated protein FlgK [Heliobacteriaceae bacterium]|nr:flagellar hook-associated protein FlgK [Heliobacteriaceae bacterium]
MISTFFGLEVARRGLLTNKIALDVTGHNVSNANTEGYSRQTVTMEATKSIFEPSLHRAQFPGQLGTGTAAIEIRRYRDNFLDLQFRNETQGLGYWEVRSDTLQKIQQMLNEHAGTGLSTVIDQFWESWEDLTAHPNQPAARGVVVQRGKAVAETFYHLDRQLAQLEADLNAKVTNTVDEINNIAKQIADLNGQILAIEVMNEKANDLRDKRDLLLDKLSKLVDITVAEDRDGMVYVGAGNGTLVSTVYNKQLMITEGNGRDAAGKSLYEVYWESSNQAAEFSSGVLRGVLESRGAMVTAGKASRFGLEGYDWQAAIAPGVQNQVRVNAAGLETLVGDYRYTVVQAATKAAATWTFAVPGAAVAEQRGSFNVAYTIRGVDGRDYQFTVKDTDNLDQVVDKINALTSFTKVTAQRSGGDIVLQATEYGARNFSVNFSGVTEQSWAYTPTPGTYYLVGTNNQVYEIAVEAGDTIDDVIGRVNEHTLTSGVTATKDGQNLKLVGAGGTGRLMTNLTGFTVEPPVPPPGFTAGTDLQVTVEYSADGGATWSPVAVPVSRAVLTPVVPLGADQELVLKVADRQFAVDLLAGDNIAAIAAKINAETGLTGVQATVDGGDIVLTLAVPYSITATGSGDVPVVGYQAAGAVTEKVILAPPTLIAAAQDLTVNGITINLAAGDSPADTVAKINAETDKTNVQARLTGDRIELSLATVPPVTAFAVTGATDLPVKYYETTGTGVTLADGLDVDLTAAAGTVCDLEITKREGIIAGTRRQLDLLAQVFTAELNKLHQEGVTLAAINANNYTGVLPPSNIKFFIDRTTYQNHQTTGTDPTSMANILVNPDLNDLSLIAAARPESQSVTPYPNMSFEGDGRNALAISQLKYHKAAGFAQPATIDEFYRSLVGNLGVGGQQAARMLDNQTFLADTVKNHRDGVTSVSLDEEMTNMIRYQQAYNSAARMISAMDEMLDILVNRLGIVGR